MATNASLAKGTRDFYGDELSKRQFMIGVIEKHFTLNKNLPGADHKISMEPREFKNMIKKIRETEKILGQKMV